MGLEAVQVEHDDHVKKIFTAFPICFYQGLPQWKKVDGWTRIIIVASMGGKEQGRLARGTDRGDGMWVLFRLVLVILVAWGGAPVGVGAQETPSSGSLHPLRGAPFSDPARLMRMPPGWVEQPIVYDEWAKREKADLAITLDQQIHLMLWEPIQRYATSRGIRIVNQEGTCGISDGMLLRKQVDMGGFCCPPGQTERPPGLKHHTLGIAAKSFIVHPANPVDDLRVEQVRGIFQGKYRLWSELEGSGGAALPIRVIGRLHCKLRPGHWRLLMDKDSQFSPSMFEVGFISDVIHQVMTGAPDAIGYETLTVTIQHPVA